LFSTSSNRANAIQLSRGKDPNKSSKKNKDSKDGTASPSSRDSNQSPVLTPSSSTSTLNDPRNKPLPQNNAGHGGEHGSGSQPSNLSNVTQAGSTPDRFATGGASSPNGGSASSRLPPTVVISPTPGVSYKSHYYSDSMLRLITIITACPSPRSRRDDATRFGPS
jgi:hypothetical protein